MADAYDDDGEPEEEFDDEESGEEEDEDEEDYEAMPPLEPQEAPPPRTGVAGWLRDAYEALTKPKMGPSGRPAARAFAASYGRLVERVAPGAPGPRFFADSYRQAAASAAAQSKLLLIYLHSELHQDSAAFCAGALATEAFDRFCRSRFVLWGADVASADGHVLASALGAAAFPFLALVVCRADREEVVERLQGAPPDAAEVLGRLEDACEQQREQLEALRRRQQSARDAQRLRSEQDRDYEEGLERDRQR
eukprot:CAMPEP_0119267576 /NCGR_PEP_ID=MMETSP1329-20130426/5664_1 /TAXON_ID=114041 /ORGANISM="Genus nov. species nov., Strain RCC1024" /LENGTH=250 /DNA_ID=CAMNT_0007267505 /DNA_START=236 /DNA_END=984 /DNA_ORIENTATION=-